ncbi:MAG: glycosyltransferase [Arachnia sp.]
MSFRPADSDAGTMRASLIVPAHNEAAVIGDLLSALPGPGLEVIVVCNGCTDGTATTARSYPGIRVIEIAEASKAAALDAGDAAAGHPVRVYIDADVRITGADITRLLGALGGPVLVAAPSRHLHLARSAPAVRWYYDVWQRLPNVGSGVFGRGVTAFSAAGHARLRSLPRVMSDDLLASEAFAPDERAVVATARVHVEAPRSYPDLLRRRVRVVTGNQQLDGMQLRTGGAKTSPAALARIATASPLMPAKVAHFLLTTAIARAWAAARGIHGTSGQWLRDESSRQR